MVFVVQGSDEQKWRDSVDEAAMAEQRIFTRYPGIFYLSLKCKTTTITLREGYQSGKLVDPHPLVRHRDKFYRVMQTGLLYLGDGSLKHDDNNSLVKNDELRSEESGEEEVETSDGLYEGESSDDLCEGEASE